MGTLLISTVNFKSFLCRCIRFHLCEEGGSEVLNAASFIINKLNSWEESNQGALKWASIYTYYPSLKVPVVWIVTRDSYFILRIGRSLFDLVQGLNFQDTLEIYQVKKAACTTLMYCFDRLYSLCDSVSPGYIDGPLFVMQNCNCTERGWGHELGCDTFIKQVISNSLK